MSARVKGSHVNGLVSTHYAPVYRRLASGKLCKRPAWRGFPCCPVVRCDRCARFGSPTWIKLWYMRRWTPEECEPVLCMACMNVMRPLYDRLNATDENAAMLRKIIREAQHANQNRR